MLPLLLLPAVSLALPTLEEPLRTGNSAPDDAAVVIGLEDYAFLPAARYARADARAFADWLVYTRGLPAERVHLLPAGSAEDMLAAVQRARAEAGAAGTLWVYYAGHGAAGSGDRRLLLLGDDARASVAGLDGRGLALDTLTGAATSGGRAVVVVDACQSGTSRDGAALLPGARPVVPVEGLPADDGLTLWLATSPGQIAGPLPPAGHGAFTWLVVGGLRGWADGELDGRRDGAVTLAEARAYVDRSLRLVSPAQTPELHTPLDLGDQVWVRARGLEAGPPAESLQRALDVGGQHLPPVTSPQGAPPPVLGGSPPAAAVPDLHPPFTHSGGPVWADAAGRPVAFAELAQVARRDADGKVAVRRLRTSGLPVVGLSVAALGLATAGELYRVGAHATQERYLEGAPGVEGPVTGKLVAGNLMLWGGVAGELAVLGVHVHRTRHLRAEIVELAEEELR